MPNHRNKVQPSVEATMGSLLESGVLKDGIKIAVGGFGLCGNPEALIKAVAVSGKKHLTIVSNNAGNMGKGLALWLKAGIVDEVICSYLGNNDDLHDAMAKGTVKVTIQPQGTFAERLRAAGAGIPAFYTPTGVGTVVEEGKELRTFGERQYILEEALHVDLALIRSFQADPFGNARFRKTTRNFSLAMATAATMTVLECDHLLSLGALDPDDVHLSGIFVHRVVHVPEHEDPFEYKTNRAI